MDQEMKYIERVYQEGSFSKAAEALYMTQPALSLAVKRVEESIGAEIFDRSRRPLQLTDAGRAYLNGVQRIRLAEEELRQEIEDLRGLQTGHLMIGGTHYINCYILAPILASFSRLYPGVSIELLERGSDSLIKALDERKIDLTFSCDPRLIRLFERKEAFHDHVLLAVPKSFEIDEETRKHALSAADILNKVHLKKETPAVPLEAFKDIEFILLKPGINMYHRSMDMFAESGFTPKIKMTLSQMVTAYRLADNAMGATMISDRLVRSPNSNLIFFRIDSQHTDRTFYLIQPSRNYTPFSVSTFIEFALWELAKKEKE